MLELFLAPADAPPLLAALAATSGHPDDPRTRTLLAFVADELGVNVDLTADPSPEALAAAVPVGAIRTAALQRLVLAAMLVPPLDSIRLAQLEHYAAALGCADDPVLGDLRRLVAGQHRRLSASLMRRFPPTERIRTRWRLGSFGERWRILKAMARLPDRATALRYQALAELPEDTLGRTFFDHCRAHGFALPGERRGFPEPLVFHDMGHGLVGCGTDIAGETRMAGFEAGCMRERGFTMLEFTLLLFNLGAKLPTDAAPAIGAVDIDILLRAYVDGRRSTLDVLAWDPWAEVAEPIVALRERYRITAS